LGFGGTGATSPRTPAGVAADRHRSERQRVAAPARPADPVRLAAAGEGVGELAEHDGGLAVILTFRCWGWTKAVVAAKEAVTQLITTETTPSWTAARRQAVSTARP
jgi:hypothetical protein